MSGRRRRAAILALAGSLAIGGCGSARRDEPFTGPHTPPDERIALGQRVFTASCNGCHPGGTQGIGPAINNKPLPGWAMKFQIRHGLGAMPAFPREDISDPELDALVAYLAWLRRLEAGPALEMPEVPS